MFLLYGSITGFNEAASHNTFWTTTARISTTKTAQLPFQSHLSSARTYPHSNNPTNFSRWLNMSNFLFFLFFLLFLALHVYMPIGECGDLNIEYTSFISKQVRPMPHKRTACTGRLPAAGPWLMYRHSAVTTFSMVDSICPITA